MDMKLGIALGRFRKPSLGALPVVLNQPTNLQVTEVAGGRSVTWTNNSEYHAGAYIYRAETLDPQNLPAPVATVAPVAQGETVEWIDSEALSAGGYDYAVQDYYESGVGALSPVATHVIPLVVPNVGDEWQGGIYVGLITYADGRQFHLVASKQSGEAYGLLWSSDTGTVGVYDPDDGWANTQGVINSSLPNTFPAFNHCVGYSNGGFDDWYMPARNELMLIYTNGLNTHPEFAINVSGNYPDNTWSSTEVSANPYWYAWELQLATGEEGSSSYNKLSSILYTRPIRRVPA